MSVSLAVVFDLGKVLLDFDYGIAADKIARKSKCAKEVVFPALSQSPLLHRFESGQMTNEEFAVEVCARCGFSGTMDEFYAAFSDIFSEIEPMIALNAALRGHRIPTCIFSNTNGLAIGHIRRRYPFFAQFDHYILSYEQGAMKPEPLMYGAVERAVGLEGQGIVYLDDRAENVEGGLARGWRAVLHESPDKTIATLAGWGLPVAANF